MYLDELHFLEELHMDDIDYPRWISTYLLAENCIGRGMTPMVPSLTIQDLRILLKFQNAFPPSEDHPTHKEYERFHRN